MITADSVFLSKATALCERYRLTTQQMKVMAVRCRFVFPRWTQLNSGLCAIMSV